MAARRIEKTKALLARTRERAIDLIGYIDASPTPYHAVEEAIRRLESADFSPLREADEWKLRAGDRRYVTKNGSTIVAFIVGSKSPARAGFKMIGAHTDSPNLKLKPRASFAKSGYRQLGVEVYGGVLLSTWLDRDLAIAGRVAVREAGGVKMRLVKLERPIVRIPNLAIHLNRDVNKDGLKLNPQTHLPPVIALVEDKNGEARNGGKNGSKNGSKGGKNGKNGSEGDVLRSLLAATLRVDEEEILDHDLSLFDSARGTLGGVDDELIFVARLDNLASCHAALDSLTESAGAQTAATRLIALYDHEEVGSKSAQGAQGPFLENVLHRIIEAHEKQEPQAYARAIAASFFVSADMAHGVHPNYADKHEPQHMPLLGQGPVVKTNAGQSYATDGESAAVFIALCREAGFDPQSFVIRTDLGCGSTIGPITAARLGVKTVDVGNPMLSMHSIREMAGTHDAELMHRALLLHLKSG
jgi:aspartyl aminopeptidase